MKITKVKITSFRNIKSLFFDAEQLNVIMGNNMKGKTNVLNAIMWCICGTDLNGSNDNLDNLPYGETIAEVGIETDNVKITRQAIKVNNSVEQHVFIDNLETPVKQAENIILDKFGLLHTLPNDTKAFKLLRFLINPLYWQSVAPKDLRKYVVNNLLSEVNISKLLEESQLSKTQINMIKSGISSYGSFEKYCVAIDTESKRIKKCKDEYEATIKVLAEFNDNSHFTQLNDKISECNNSLLSIKQKQAINDEFALLLNQAYQKLFNDKNISITLLEKGQGEDVWKEVCYPQLLNNKLSASLGSTAETIFVSTLFVETIRTALNLKPYTMLIDEGETLDIKTLTSLRSCVESQLFITKVEFEEKEGITICH